MNENIERFNQLLARRKKALSLGAEKVKEFREQFDSISYGILSGIVPYLQDQLQISNRTALLCVMIEAEKIGALHHFVEGVRMGEIELVELGVQGMKDLVKGKVLKCGN